MSASDHLNDIQFSVYTGGDDKVGQGAVYAHSGSTLRTHEGKPYRNTDNVVGKLVWGMQHAYGDSEHSAPHEIDEVWVHPDYRRQGIATAMHGFAQSVASEVRHSDKRTEKGDAWAQAQGAAPAKKRVTWGGQDAG